jgi:hypothetical protein
MSWRSLLPSLGKNSTKFIELQMSNPDASFRSRGRDPPSVSSLACCVSRERRLGRVDLIASLDRTAFDAPVALAILYWAPTEAHDRF